MSVIGPRPQLVRDIFINKIKNSFYTVKTDIFNSGHE